MSERKFKGRVIGVLLSLIFVFTTVFGAVNLTSVNAQAEETAASEVKLYIKTSTAHDELYFAPWYKGGMWIASDDQNEHGQYFWGQDQAKLTAIDDSKTLYSIQLMIIRPLQKTASESTHLPVVQMTTVSSISGAATSIQS